MITLYNVISKDWFIAKNNDSEEFIPDELWPLTLEIYKGFSMIMMGRRTYEVIQSYPAETIQSFEKLDLKKIVVTNNPDFKVKEGYTIVDEPKKIASGENILVSSGPVLNNYLLQHGLVDKIIMHQISTILGDGILVFDEKYRVNFNLESDRDLGLTKELIFKAV